VEETVEETANAGSEVAREINTRVLETAAILDGKAPADNAEPLDFVCECGCLGRIAISPSAYLTNGGAWIHGHKQAANGAA
jgi:hypothetical protein